VKRVAVLFLVVILVCSSCVTRTVMDSPYAAGSNLASSFVSSNVIDDFYKSNGRRPVIVIGTVYSLENLDYSQIVRGFQQVLITSGKTDMILGSSERDIIREERMDQLQWSSMDQAKSLANETAADFFGRIYIDATKGGYIISADIIDVETGRIFWVGQNQGVVSLNIAPARTTSPATASTDVTETEPETPTASETTPVVEPETAPVVEPAPEPETKTETKPVTDNEPTEKKSISISIQGLPMFDLNSAIEVTAHESPYGTYYEARKTLTAEDSVMSFVWSSPDTTQYYRIEITSDAPKSVHIDTAMQHQGGRFGADIYGGDLKVSRPSLFGANTLFGTMYLSDPVGVEPCVVIYRFVPVGDKKNQPDFNSTPVEGDLRPLNELIADNAIISLVDITHNWWGAYEDWPYNPFTSEYVEEQNSTPVIETKGKTLMAEDGYADLSLLEDGDSYVFNYTDGRSESFSLDGLTVDSLYSIELPAGTRVSSSRGLLCFDGYYRDYTAILIPQGKGKGSFTGRDFGLSGSGTFKITKAMSCPELYKTKSGNLYFSFKVDYTDINYWESGYSFEEVPIDLSYCRIDLTDPAWARYKEKGAVICQVFKNYDPYGGNFSTESTFGLVGYMNGRIFTRFDREAEGIIDLSGRDTLNVYSAVKRGNVDSDDLRLETFFILPIEIEPNSEPVAIQELPQAFLFKADFHPDKAYVISLRDVPFEMLDAIYFANVPSYRVTAEGSSFETRGFIQNISMENGKINVDFYFKNISDDFIQKMQVVPSVERESYGTISLREADSSWLSEHCIDLNDSSEHTVRLKKGESCSIIWELPYDDAHTYRLTVRGSGMIAMSQKQEGLYSSDAWNNGGIGNHLEETVIISNTGFISGFFTVLATENSSYFSWKVERID